MEYEACPCPICKGEMKWTKVKLKIKTEEGFQNLGGSGKILVCERCWFHMNFVQDGDGVVK